LIHNFSSVDSVARAFPGAVRGVPAAACAVSVFARAFPGAVRGVPAAACAVPVFACDFPGDVSAGIVLA